MNRFRTMSGMLVLTITVAFLARPAAAQTCGDANDDGAVTVTDGVQALRAAADLSSSCEEGCDVDGNGAVTVSDGVNILRRAAGLTSSEACDFTAEETSDVVAPSLSIFGAMTKVPGIGSASALVAAAGDCENDGTIERLQLSAQSAATFTNCEIQGAVLDGTIGRVVLGQGVVLGFDGFRIRHLKTGRSHTFNGQLSVADERLGKRLGGSLTITSSRQGTFTLEFQRILLAGDGSVRQGTLIYDLTKITSGKIASVEIIFDDGDQLPVNVELRNQKVKQFLLDRATLMLHLPR